MLEGELLADLMSLLVSTDECSVIMLFIWCAVAFRIVNNMYIIRCFVGVFSLERETRPALLLS